MWKKRDIVRAVGAIIAGLAGLALMRFLVYDYIPPESLIRDLERSGIVNAGTRKLAMAVYGTLALAMMAVFFKVVQERWPGRRGMKGFVFGASVGVVWSFGFLGGWVFLGATLSDAILNSIVDLIPLSFTGWLIGLAVGCDVVRPQHSMWKPWLAIFLVALGFVAVHALGTYILADHVASTAALLFVPSTLPQITLLFGLGVWAGGMFVLLRAGLPFDNTWARIAFFAFGVFGHSWIWFHLFLVIEFAGILQTGLIVGLMGSLGVFAGALAYEGIASGRHQAR
jgi:hypothetical protein